jgi:hypothetical protein
MEDLKIKAAKEYYDSVGMTPNQIIDTIEALGFRNTFDRIYHKYLLGITVDEYYVPKYQVVVICTNISTGTKNTLINPRYASQIQQLIKDTHNEQLS